MASGICYIMTNRPRGVLYTRVTTDIGRRAIEHRDGTIKGFTSRYGLRKLVFYEEYSLFIDAVQREKNIKHWPWQWKIELIEKMNPNWEDLFHSLA
jgi:putative endonuclease